MEFVEPKTNECMLQWLHDWDGYLMIVLNRGMAGIGLGKTQCPFFKERGITCACALPLGRK
jgi:hypothetical protein